VAKKPTYEELERRVKALEAESFKRKQAEQKTEKSISILRAALESTADGLMVVNREGKIVSLNKNLEEMWQIPRSIIEMRDDNLILGCILEQLNDPEGFLERVEKLYTQPDADSYDIIELKDGRIFERYSRPQRIGEKSVGRVWSFRDITDGRRAQEELERSFSILGKTLEGIIHAMVLTVEKRDPYTAGHQRRVAAFASDIATAMGLSEEQINQIRLAGIIHDIGKICIPSDILTRTGRLSENEFGIIKDHAHVGYDILKEIKFPWPLAQIVYQHHERLDGSGYPRGLSGDEILLEAKIIGVSDVVEAMASHRPYRPTLGMDLALEEITKYRAKLYDREVVDISLKLLREKSFKFE